MTAEGDSRTMRTSPGSFFAARWRGETPLARVFWFDMVLVGTMVNVAMSVAALLALATGAPLALALAIHFLILPYNVFLLISVWRSSANADVKAASAARTGAVLWLIAATLI